MSLEESKWLQVNADQLFHPLPAKRLYKKLFVEQLRRADLYAKMPQGVLKKSDWAVNIKPVGDGKAVTKYLPPYVYRVAISDSRITSVDDHGVSYTVKPSGKRVYEPRRLEGERFVRAFAQHILPPGLQKVRYYGFMSPNSKLQLAKIRWLVWLWRGWCFYLASQLKSTEPQPTQASPRCQHCKGTLQLIRVTSADDETLWSANLPDLTPRPSMAPRFGRGPPRRHIAVSDHAGVPLAGPEVSKRRGNV